MNGIMEGIIILAFFSYRILIKFVSYIYYQSQGFKFILIFKHILTDILMFMDKSIV